MRDNPVAAERLCALLGTSRLLGRLVDRIPPFLATLGDDAALRTVPGRSESIAEAVRRVEIHSADDPAAALHRFHAGRLLHVAGMDLTGTADVEAVGRRLTDTADAVVSAALAASVTRARERGEDPPPMAVIALGKWGGGELNYASDLDAIVVHDGDGRDPAEATAAADRIVADMLATLDAPGIGGPTVDLDLELRPEGRSGPLSRSVSSYRAYWERWADTWELQALLRARPAAGDDELGAALQAEAAEVVHRPDHDRARTGAIRRMKARVERERIPAHEDPDFHMKLGRGGMADVEWTVQLLQLRHGHSDPSLRTPGTLPGIAALRHAGFLAADDAASLDEAYRFCALVRNRLYLQAGRARDSLPADPAEVTRLARSLGYVRRPRSTLREDYRRVTRRARRIVERVFYGQ
jgi:glutamate-ammonia-ligase adenylyltransferase